MFSTPPKPKGLKLKKGPLAKGPPGLAKGEELTVQGNLKLLLDDQEGNGSALPEQIEKPDESVDAPLIRLVNCLLAEAIKSNASDIHIEPFESILRVRFRVDGVLQEVQKIPLKLASSISSRLKIMANLDICERRIPQDGSFNLKAQGVEADFRMSTLPSQFGEKVVLRVMGTAGVNNDLSKLGIPGHQLKTIREAIHRPDGLVLVTGPTGSGKTTTLYAGLNELNDISVSVFTAEDPIEGTLQGVTQCQVNPQIGYTFASVLRSLLRQDPDVILVGEIRDQETAEMSIKAALTGHLVLSTLHTNCSVSTIQRLLNMGVAPYLITTSINCIVAQRLVRRICEDCKESMPAPPELLAKLGPAADDLQGIEIKHGQGCPKCRNSGYKGRAPIYEVLVLDDHMRAMILSGASREALKAYALRAGMVTLRKAGLALVKEGITTIEEVLGATTEDSAAPQEETGVAELPKAMMPELQPAVGSTVQIVQPRKAPVQAPRPGLGVSADVLAAALSEMSDGAAPQATAAPSAGAASAGANSAAPSAGGARWRSTKLAKSPGVN